ncbi:MAG: STAS domain-containing protein [Planctomycetes bacterium]|nr:STAS domain-containing protein [Planctomycetota bacterium]
MSGLLFDVVEADNGNVMISVHGDLVLDTVEQFNSTIQAVPEDAKAVSLDLSGISRISSAGIGALVSRSHELMRSGKAVSIQRPAPQVARLLKHTSLNDMLKP